MYRILFHFIYSLFTSFHTKYHTLFSLMKSKSSSLFRSIESNGYFSIIEANIIQYYHSRFKIATIIRGKCEDQTVSLDILIFGDGKVVHLPRSNIRLSKCMLCWPTLIDRYSTRTMLLGCRMLEMTEVKHRRCSNYSTLGFVSEQKVRLIKCHRLKIRYEKIEFCRYWKLIVLSTRRKLIN